MASKKRINNEINKINNPSIEKFKQFYLVIKNPKPLFNFKLNKNILSSENYYEIINLTEYTLLIKLKIDNQIMNIRMVMPDTYPFKPPKVEINNKDYHRLLQSNNIRKIKKTYCLCCSSLICQENWGPFFGIINIINEIYQNIYNKKNIIIILHLPKIEKKFLGFSLDIQKYIA